MKPRAVDLSDIQSVEEAIRRISMIRFAEVLTLSTALRKRKSVELHAFRIACKRARYTLERFAPQRPTLSKAASCFAEIQNALGEAHDRDVLLERIATDMPKTAQLLRKQREACVSQAAGLWKHAFTPYGSFEGLLRFTGFG